MHNFWFEPYQSEVKFRTTHAQKDIAMGLPRTFVGFSSTDIGSYHLMTAWKAHEHIEFNFTDCQLAKEVNSLDEAYIKRRCRERIDMAGTFVSIIGKDTATKHKFVTWELEVALEKGCRIIGVNLNGSRIADDLCPKAIWNTGSIFVPFSPNIIAYTLANWKQEKVDNWHYKDHIYKSLGY